MRIIPAIDIIGGKCVRLTKGDYATKKVYNEHPLEVAKMFEDNGMQYLHLVDLDGAKSQHIVNYKVLRQIAENTNLEIDFGGGLKTDKDLEIAFENGAAQITGGSIAMKKPMVFLNWLKQYGPEKIILGADCLDRKIATQGWTENSDIDIIGYLNGYEKHGVQSVICTDIAKDGMLQGSSTELYREILQETNVNLIASGGVASMEDLTKLEAIGCEGVIIGKAIYENKISLQNLKSLC